MPFMDLSVGYYRVNFIAQQPIELPRYAGSAWRGIFGHALRKISCVTGAKTCDDCLLKLSCSYPYLFDTPPRDDSEIVARSKSVPHPYVFRPLTGGKIDSGQCLSVEVLLFGMGNQYLGPVIHALAQGSSHGLGRGRGVAKLQSVEQLAEHQHWQQIYAPDTKLQALAATPVMIPELPAGRLRIQLLSPLRLRRKNVYITPERFNFADMFNSLMLRISQLGLRHAGKQPEVDYGNLASLAREQIIGNSQLRWQEWGRYSQRQQTSMQMGGLLGSFELEGAALTHFWPWLWLGQYTHAGKACTMGLGQYSIVPISSSHSSHSA